LIDQWRREQSLLRTWERRPDLLDIGALTPDDRAFIARLEQKKNPTRTNDEKE
jgi:tRNA (guanine37-N1)-methyltransferase